MHDDRCSARIGTGAWSIDAVVPLPATKEGIPMDWLYLLVAGGFEIGWPVGLKLSETMPNKLIGLAIAGVCMGCSGLLLWIAQKTIPIGAAYAVWTGIGAAGAFIVGMLFFNDPWGVLRMVSVVLIIAGVAGLRLAH
jgi:quaternary ammonium compound-resistance protein SugE